MIILFSAGALILGAGIGYYLRVIIALGKRRSIEIDIKQMMVGAKEEAQKITDEAKKLSEVKLVELKRKKKKKEQEFKEKDTRLIKKTNSWTRQVEIDKEIENIKNRAEEIKRFKKSFEN